MSITSKACLCLLAVSILDTAHGQGSDQLLACSKIENEEERLACFDTAILSIKGVEQPEPVSPLASPSQGLSELQNQTPPRPNQAAAVEPVVPSAEGPAEPVGQLAEAGTSGTANEQESDGQFLPNWFPRIGAANSGKKEAEEQVFDTQIVRIQRNNVGRHYFTTDDGHVFRQIGVGDIRAPGSLPSAARIRPTITGGIRLEIIETDQSYTVLRVE